MVRTTLPRRKRWLCLLGGAGVLAAGAAASYAMAPLPGGSRPAERTTPQIVGYVFPQHNLLRPGDVEMRKLTRINYAFANIKDGKIVAGFPTDPANLAMLRSMRKDNPSLSLLVSVGGWLWSGGFSDMVLTRQSRARFIDGVSGFVATNGLDGLDIDWEYPGIAGATQNFRPEDKQNYTALMRELRARFDRDEKLLHRKLLITLAVGSSNNFLAHTEMDKVQHYVDAINLMAYDYYESDTDRITGHHAPLFTDPADPKHVSADRSIRAYEAAGVLPSKLVLGVPFYGRAWGSVGNENHGLFQPGAPAPGVKTKYRDIEESMLGHGYTRYWDQASRVPYLYNSATKTFVSYEDAASLAIKCSYVREHQLAGIMFWDYASDPSGTLLGAVYSGFHSTTAHGLPGGAR